MAEIHPFVALRPRPDLCKAVASVPYDVVDTEEARALAAGNPTSYLHVVRAEIDFDASVHIYDDRVYAKARENFERLIQDGVLQQDNEPSLYIYRQRMGNHVQHGIVATCSVDEYDQDRIKKHEKTRPDKENDRTRLTIDLRAHTGPVFLTYRDDAEIDGLVHRTVAQSAPLYDFTAVDGIQHTVWRALAQEDLVKAFQRIESLYVADGHHRSASASRARKAMQEQNPAHTGKEAYNRFLAVLFPSSQLKILAYNRVVKDLNGLSAEELLTRLRTIFDVREDGAASPAARGQFAMRLRGRWHTLIAPKALTEATDPVECLDAAILQSQVLGPLLGIDDPRTSQRIDFVGGIRGTDELVRRVEALPTEGVAFSLFPLPIEQLIAVSDAGRVLPPKSTWFEPKLRSGLLVHRF